MSKKRRARIPVSIFFSLLSGGLFLAAQEGVPQKAPVNPVFSSWQQKHNHRGIPGPMGGSKEGGPRTRGYIPRPVDLSHIKGPIFTQGVGDPPIPAFFDLRVPGFLTPVKDQGQYGTCWTFACMGSLESTQLKAGKGAFDLSEWHLAYFAYHPFNDSLLSAFTPGVVAEGEDPIFDQGGNDFISSALLSRGTGAVNEKACPYQEGPYRKAPRPAGDLPNGRENVSVPLGETLFLFNTPTPTTPNDVKYALLHYGATVISMDWEDSNFDEAMNTYRDTTATEDDLNHEVCIVGWNDNFETCRFPENNRPEHPGAWIVRNSWSRDWGNNGYFYISYDSNIFDGTVFVGTPRTCHKVYQYDPLGWVSSRGFGATSAYCANVYRAHDDELLTAVSFYSGAVNTSYEISLVTPIDLASGHEAALADATAAQKGTLAVPGYHIVPLANPVGLSKGADFALVLKLTTPGYHYPIPVQEKVDGYSESGETQHGRSFISPDGKSWQDLSPDCKGATICLKAIME